MKHTALVNIAALITSNSGNIMKAKNALPMAGKVSVRKSQKNSQKVGKFHDLKHIILTDLTKVPNSGTI